MKFANLETSKKLYELLKETGTKIPESEFVWLKEGKEPFHECECPKKYRDIVYYGTVVEVSYVIACPAYSFDEVEDMLPDSITEDDYKFHYNKTKTCVSYVDLCDEDHPLKKIVFKDNQTQAAHELLIWVLKDHKDGQATIPCCEHSSESACKQCQDLTVYNQW